MSSVTTLYGMFGQAFAFNQDISGWDVSSVENMGYMFYDAGAFNQDISGWNVGSVTNFGSMFWKSILTELAFNQNLCEWNDHFLSGATTTGMFRDSGCTIKSDPTSTNVCQSCN